MEIRLPGWLWGWSIRLWGDGRASGGSNLSYPLARDWCDSHWGTRLLELRDPDGQTIIVQHPGA